MTSHPLQRATQPPGASQKDQLCSTTPHWGRPPSEKMPRARAPLLLLLGLVLCEYGHRAAGTGRDQASATEPGALS